LSWKQNILKIRYFNLAVAIQLVYFICLVSYYLLLFPEDNQATNAMVHVAAFWVACIIFLLWTGNHAIYGLLNEKLPWTKRVSYRFYIQLLASGLYSLICVNSTYYFFKTTFTELPPDSYQFTLLNIYGILFTLPVISIQFGLFFMKKWRKVAVEKEKLEKEHLRTELLTLKSHIDPHFLFNNLNILSSLIEEENQSALDFLDNFAEVYRYVLKNKATETVSLGTELGFIKAYCFILQKRFEGQLTVNFDIADRDTQKHIPPLALQMLVENALKHNKLSYKKPLDIHISTEGGEFLTVRNNLQLKQKRNSFRSASGLNNIQSRYQFITKKAVEIRQSDDFFTVRVPLLNNQNIAHV